MPATEKVDRRKGLRDKPRADAMAAMYRQGCSLEQIGQKYGVTLERVRQIVKKLGLSRYDGGQSRRAQARRSRAQSSKDARSLAKWGCAFDVYAVIVEQGGTYAWQQQRRNAMRRGIAWELSLHEWWRLWQESGKWPERGRGGDKYVMSRIKDSGPYAIGNVHIQTLSENSRDAVDSWRGKKKDFRGVFFLYPGTDRPWCARWKKLRLGYFATQAEAAMARLSAQMRSEVEGLA